MRRPLSILCLVVLLAVAVQQWLFPPAFSKETNFSGLECSAIGRVERIETKTIAGQRQSIIYLKQISYFQVSESSNYPNEELNKEMKGLACYMKECSQAVRIGSILAVQGTFQYFAEATNPGEFDACLYNHILGFSGQLKNCRVVYAGETYDWLKDSLYRLRLYFQQKIEKCFPAKEAGIIVTMLLGDKSELDAEIKELYKEASILHILSVSGLHVSAIAYTFYKLLRRLGVPMKAAAIVSIIWIWLYGIMIDMGVSAFRAIVMFSIRMLADWCGRTYDLLTALVVAAVWMIFEQPLFFYHSGFWLSFVCVLAISLVYPHLKLPEDGKIEMVREGLQDKLRFFMKEGIRGLLDSLLLSVSITIATLPIFLVFYYEVSFWGILWNLFVVPLMSMVLGGGIAVLLMPKILGVGIKILVQGICLLLRFFEILCRVTELSGTGSIIMGKPLWWQIVLFVGGLFFFVVMAGKIKYKYRFPCLLCLIILLLFPVPSSFQITFLDVGQGDGICIQNDNGNVYLIDGGSSSKSKVGIYQMLPFLKREGIRSVESVFISHSDEDHMNGIMQLLEEAPKLRIKSIILSNLDEELLQAEYGELFMLCDKRKVKVYTIQAGDVLTDGKLKFTVLHPPVGCLAEGNAASQVLLLEYGNFSALLTGDVEEEGERLLQEALEQSGIGEVTLLKVAHHGSRYSTSTEFLNIVKPQIAVISCGKNNMYGHPHAETVKRLKEVGARILTTSESGAVTVEMRKGIKVYGFKE